MFKIYKYLKLSKPPRAMVVRHMGHSKGQGKGRGKGQMNKCSEDCPHEEPKPIDCKSYECIRRKKIQVVQAPVEIPSHDFLKGPGPSNAKLWRNIFLLICLPTIIGFCCHIYLTEEVEKRPKYVEFSYLRIRKKGYVWDPVRTLFHNPRNNALPGGYEVEVPEEEEYDPFSVV